MAENVSRRLREQNYCASTIKIKLRWPDFTTITRQVTLQQPSGPGPKVIYEAALGLFQQNWHPGKAVQIIRCRSQRTQDSTLISLDFGKRPVIKSGDC